MNKLGKIVAWQLTKGTVFAEVETMLTKLYDRAKSQGQVTNTVYVDDCCKLRNKIIWKRNRFHAIQRITRAVSKRHRHIQRFVSDLRLVFREDGDSETQRTSPHPLLINFD